MKVEITDRAKVKITKTVADSHTTFLFEIKDEEGGDHTAKIVRDNNKPNEPPVATVDNTEVKAKRFKEFFFCEINDQGDQKAGDPTCSCHRLISASDGAILTGNKFSCPVFLDPPGFWYDP